MQIGASSSCFYPMHTERAAQLLQDAGFPVIELFLNAVCELEPSYTAALRRQLAQTGTRVISFHPFSSSMEPYYFATDYDRRSADGMELYRRLFDCAAGYGARFFNFHGDLKATPYPFERYCEKFLQLSRLAAQYGLTLCQENVARCKCGGIDNILQMRRLLGDEVHFTLDLKQALRSGANLFEMARAMGPALCHLHLSDHAPGRDCLAPGCGEFDFVRLFAQLAAGGYGGDAVIELYRDNFGDLAELCGAAGYLRRCERQAAADMSNPVG